MMIKLHNVLLACALGAGIFGSALPASAQVSGGIYIQTAPPAPIYETVPVAPGPGTSGLADTGDGTVTATYGLSGSTRTGRTPARHGTRATR